jgi:3'(2'), 5'-bisphosphate nucleotidase
MKDLLKLARQLIPVVREAGEIELKYYRAGGAEVMDKSDGSPVTLADQEAETHILKRLKEIAPEIPVIGEEAVAAGSIPDISSGTFFLVDPLDGTKEFITGGGDFTVNIALMVDNKPVMGIIYAPVSDELYFAGDGQAFSIINGAAEKKLSVRGVPKDGLTVVASKRHGDPEKLADFLRGKKVDALISRSSSLKFCAMAAGEADLYPRLGPTCEWDIAAGEAILRAAGGQTVMLDGQPMQYGKADRKFLNPEFIAFASNDAHPAAKTGAAAKPASPK